MDFFKTTAVARPGVFPNDLAVKTTWTFPPPTTLVAYWIAHCIASCIGQGPGPDQLGLKCYLARGGTRVVGGGGKGPCRFYRQVIWKHTGPSTRGCFEKAQVVFTAKSFGNTLGLAARGCFEKVHVVFTAKSFGNTPGLATGIFFKQKHTQ